MTARWGVAGAGAIAGSFVDAVPEMGGGVVTAVGSDDPGRAAAFAVAHDIPVSVATREALASA